MWREILLGLPILTNYARAVYAAANPPTYQLGPAAHGDFADDRIGQASVGSAGTVSSEGLTRTAQMLVPIVNAAPAGSSCNTTPIILTTPVESAGTWTAIAGCAHVSVQAFGAGQGPGAESAHPPGGKGGGYGAENGVSVTPGTGYGYWIGGGQNPIKNTFFCNDVPANCLTYASVHVVAMGTSGSDVYAGLGNIGSTKFDGGAGAANAGNYGGFGGGGGGAGPHGAGGAGSVASYGTGGAGGQGDNGTGGAGGPANITGTNGTAGSAGVNVSGYGAGGGGGGAGYNANNPGGGGAWGGAAAGHSGGVNLTGISAGQGGIILTPAP